MSRTTSCTARVRGLGLLLSSGLLLATSAPSVSAAVLNFGSLSQPGAGFNNLGGVLVHDGYQFTSSLSTLGVWQNSSPNHPVGGAPSTSLMEFFAGGQTTMTKVGGGAFDLSSIDLAGYTTAGAGPFGVTFTGTRSDSSIVQQTFNPLNAGGATPVLQNFAFSGFTDLVSLSFTQGFNGSTAYQFNNLVVNDPAPPPSGGVAIANYQNDFSAPAFPSGWQYLWNPVNVPITNTAGYVPALWNGEEYTSDGGPHPPFRPYPGSSLYFGPNVGHPGDHALGAALGGDDLEHYAIFAYTITTAADSYYIGDSLIQMIDPNHIVGFHTLDLRISINNNAPIFTQFDFDSTTFDIELPGATVGDTIYVAVGPNVSSNHDAFLFDFSIYGVPEPGGLTLGALAIAGLAIFRVRPRTRCRFN